MKRQETPATQRERPCRQRGCRRWTRRFWKWKAPPPTCTWAGRRRSLHATTAGARPTTSCSTTSPRGSGARRATASAWRACRSGSTTRNGSTTMPSTPPTTCAPPTPSAWTSSWPTCSRARSRATGRCGSCGSPTGWPTAASAWWARPTTAWSTASPPSSSRPCCSTPSPTPTPASPTAGARRRRPGRSSSWPRAPRPGARAARAPVLPLAALTSPRRLLPCRPRRARRPGGRRRARALARARRSTSPSRRSGTWPRCGGRWPTCARSRRASA